MKGRGRGEGVSKIGRPEGRGGDGRGREGRGREGRGRGGGGSHERFIFFGAGTARRW